MQNLPTWLCAAINNVRILADHRLERMLRDERASADRPFGDVWLDALEAEAKRRGWK
jgi:hypothetical protein